VRGRVVGVTDGSLFAELVIGGQSTGTQVVGADRTVEFATSAPSADGTRARVVVTRAAPDGQILGIGAAIVADDFTDSDLYEGIDVTVPDVRAPITVDTSNLPDGARARYTVLMDGGIYTFSGNLIVTGDVATFSATPPAFVGGLADVTARLVVQVGDEVTDQPGIFARVSLIDDGSMAGAVAVTLPDPPDFAIPLGTGETDAPIIARDQLAGVVAAGFDRAGSALILSGTSGDKLYWETRLRAADDVVAPALPATTLAMPFPMNRVVAVTLEQRREQSGGGTTLARRTGVAVVSGDERSCAGRLPEWTRGKLGVVATEDVPAIGDTCPSDTHSITVDECGRLFWAESSTDTGYFVDGRVFVHPQSQVLILASHEQRNTGGRFLPTDGNAMAMRLEASPYHQASSILLSRVDDHSVLGRLIRVEPPDAANQWPLEGSFVGHSVQWDILASDNGVPGAVLEEGSLVTGIDNVFSSPVGSFRLSIGDGGEWKDRRSKFSPDLTVSRSGIVTAWDGESGTVAYTSGDGVCSDADGIAQVSVVDIDPDTEGLEVVTVVEKLDETDADGDGDTAELVFERQTVVFAPKV
jgi:hypothetical protein